MNEVEKIVGEERQVRIIERLKNAKKPIPGRALGEEMNVSRQVIVGDITLLKAKGEPILATNRGYVYLQQEETTVQEQLIVCRHTAEQTEEELHILVDHGILVKDVKIEHSVYGNLSASIMVSNRQEVQTFLHHIEQSKAAYLLNLTENGIHMHTIESQSEEQIQLALHALKKAGILVE